MNADWKPNPIETAPRDGTWFLTINEQDGPSSMEVGCYSPITIPSYELVEGGLYRRVETSVWDWQGFSNIYRATHWRKIEV